MVEIAVKNFTLNLQLSPISHVLSPQIGDAAGARGRRGRLVVEGEKWGGRDAIVSFLQRMHVCSG